MLYFILVVLQIVFSYIFSIIETKLIIQLTYNLNYQIINHLQKVSLISFNQQNIPYLNQRINTDCNVVINFLYFFNKEYNNERTINHSVLRCYIKYQ